MLLAFEADTPQHGGGHLLGRSVRTEVTPGVETLLAHMRCGYQHVVQRGVVVKQVHDLKRARHALAGNVARRQTGDVLARKSHPAAVRLVAARQHVKAGGFAGAVGPHDAGQLTFLETERDVLQHHLCAETLGQALGLKKLHSTPPAALVVTAGDSFFGLVFHACQTPAIPSGLNSTMTMKMRPYQRSQVSV